MKLIKNNIILYKLNIQNFSFYLNKQKILNMNKIFTLQKNIYFNTMQNHYYIHQFNYKEIFLI